MLLYFMHSRCILHCCQKWSLLAKESSQDGWIHSFHQSQYLQFNSILAICSGLHIQSDQHISCNHLMTIESEFSQCRTHFLPPSPSGTGFKFGQRCNFNGILLIHSIYSFVHSFDLPFLLIWQRNQLALMHTRWGIDSRRRPIWLATLKWTHLNQ